MKSIRRTNEKGITLIALVLTIIVLLIISGISISMLTGQNGILNRTVEAKEKTTLASEKEAIVLDFINNNMSQNNDYSIGEKLYDRNIANGNKWKIIYDTNNEKIYGTNWMFISKETDIDNYGKTLNNWLVNIQTEEILSINDGEYKKLQYGDNLAVTDGLILNVDPINMSDNNSWGDGVTLKGVRDGDGYGFNGNEIKLDGVDDYIEIYTGDNDMSEGITYEYYGKLKDKTTYLLSKAIRKPDENWDKRYSQLFRMHINTSIFSARIWLDMNGAVDSESNWKNEQVYDWITKDFNIEYFNDDEGYITVTQNLNENTVTIYWNGNYIDKTNVNHNWMIGGGLNENSIPFVIGFQTGGIEYTEMFSSMNIYACRLYNKVLTSEEIKENYNKTVEYRKMLMAQ